MEIYSIRESAIRVAVAVKFVPLLVAVAVAPAIGQDESPPPIDFDQAIKDATADQQGNSSAPPEFDFGDAIPIESQDSDVIDFQLDDDLEGFGEEDFEMPSEPGEEEMANTIAMIIGAVCTSIPTLLLGLAIGYFFGRRRSK